MLENNPQTVCFVIDKAHEFHAKEQVTIPATTSDPTEDWAMQVLADHKDDLTYQELVTTINGLEQEQQVELVALMWLGRGDYDLEEWALAKEAAREAWNERTADYLMATPLVADYLMEALNLQGYSCEE